MEFYFSAVATKTANKIQRRFATSGANRSRTRRVQKLSVVVFAVWILLHAVVACPAQRATPWPDRVEAAQSDWQAQTPPDSGWVQVSLPDDWSERWPEHDGVVWYRLSWQQATPVQPLGFMLPYVRTASAIYLNGIELRRDEHLVEPLSRMSNTPLYLQLTPPLLREGENRLLIRVSGLAPYQPGLPAPIVGKPETVSARYRDEFWQRHDLLMIGLAVSATLAGFFLAIWLMRRKEVVYGWFGAAYLLWWYFTTNDVAQSPWPFSSTNAYEKCSSVMFLLCCPCDILFMLRYCGRRYPRFEAGLWIFAVLGSLLVIAAPHDYIELAQEVFLVAPGLLHIAAWAVFAVVAWRGERIDQKLMAVCFAVVIVPSVHDLLVFMRVLDSNLYYTDYISLIVTIGWSLAMAWNFIQNLSRIESFNSELLDKVDTARRELAATLKNQHELELVRSRLGERLSLAHDLHDGFGGVLISNIVKLERAPGLIDSNAMLSVLKELRDDLRLIIDTAAGHQYGEHSLAELHASLRYRMTRLFEAHGIECEWQVTGLEDVYLTTTQSLDVLRILQEALANVFKHSRASRVDIELANDREALQMQIKDNGLGFDTGQTEGGKQGTGLRSMQARAARLGATLTLTSQVGKTLLRLHMPLPGVATKPASQPVTI